MSRHQDLNVKVWTEDIIIPTYSPFPPDKNPMFLEKRVYQGSSGKIYPLPFTDRISEVASDRRWQAIFLENQYLQVMILPEIGGRIHAILDKTNNYDTIYRQKVIKPALVGLAGSWISGGIEFNWAQHHRPATFSPVNFEIEEHAGGAKTVWCGDHEPMARMKGMHGVCLHPDKSLVELKARVYNRTELPQTFLWWANAATKVHEGYQSFFPPDVSFVADHAKRATSEYPLCQGFYYGVNYGARARDGIPAQEIPSQFVPPSAGEKSAAKKLNSKIPNYAPNDLSWYANIPVPTSYMCAGSNQDFFGGYDYLEEAGIVHVADHRIAPGKKQWTWGNHEFGYAWDRNLSDDGAPYIELMAGVFTDNQPDFSFLGPGETKSWSQYWYPIREIGAAQNANLNAAVSLKIDRDSVRIGVSATARFDRALIRLESDHDKLEWYADLSPDKPFVTRQKQGPKGFHQTRCVLRVIGQNGDEIISYEPEIRSEGKAPESATEPPPPAEIGSCDELLMTGLHLAQYRHATRSAESYWREALRRDPLDARCNNALGLMFLRRGEFAKAESFFRRAVKRLTVRNPNPYDGEPFYNLGLCLRFGALADRSAKIENRKFDQSYDAFYKATWNQAQAGAGFHCLAEMDCLRKHWSKALEHLNSALKFNAGNLRARNLKTLVLRRLDQQSAANDLLRQTIALDPLDWWARYLNGEKLECDRQTALDIAHDFARAGFYEEAVKLLNRASKQIGAKAQDLGAEPMMLYTIGWLYENLDDSEKARAFYQQASAATPDYCFPHRLEEIVILESAIRTNPADSFARFYLGNLFYDRQRYAEAITLWKQSTKINPNYSVVWRNLGIGFLNVFKNRRQAITAYEKAFRANKRDARLLYERDQLWKRVGEKPEKRLRELEKYSALVAERDDLTIELCALYNQTGRSEKSLKLLESRNFQPWEGGEGQTLAQHTATHLSLGKAAYLKGKFQIAREHFETALASPVNLGEAKHLLVNQSDVYYCLGNALNALGETSQARRHWLCSASFKGDFQGMSVRAFSEMTYFSALSLQNLGEEEKAADLLKNLLRYARKLARTPAKIDYFATSLPAMLLFENDIQLRQETTAKFLQAQAYLGLGHRRKARRLLAEIIKSDPNHAFAADLLGRQIIKYL